MPKQILFADELRAKLKKGVDVIYEAVSCTLGPKGRSVLMERPYGSPLVTKDGVSVANQITPLEDPFENLGASLVREAAAKTNDDAGDGTTTATVLAHALFTEALESANSGVSVTDIKKGIDLGVATVVEYLKTDVAKPVKGKDAEKVAQISANDAKLGSIIYGALNSVGENGVVTVENSNTFGIDTEVVDGMKLDKGYISQHMATNPEKGEAEYNEVLVAVTDQKVAPVEHIIAIAEAAMKTGKKELLLICEDCGGEALQTLVVNKLRGIFNTLVVKSPGFGDTKKEILKDIAALTGATLISEETGLKLTEFKPEYFGMARRVLSTKDNTIIVGNPKSKDAVQGRITVIKTELEKATSQFDQSKLKERLGKLSGGVAVIKVGAATETEAQEIKQRIEDALSATKAAVEEGVVPGGGVALFRAVQALRKFDGTYLSLGENRGMDILREALTSPLRRIASNAGADCEYVMSTVKDGKDAFGYNADTGEFVDMVKAGILDPMKVTRLALQNAASVACLLLTSDAAIIDKKDKLNPMN